MDSDIRALERTGGGLMERLRANEIPTFTESRDGACDHKNWTQVECAAAQHEHPFDPQDLLRLLAFLGVEEAREAVGEAWEAVLNLVSVEFRLWSGSLRDLLTRLPPHRLEVKCANCRHGVVSLGPRCRRCQDHDTPAKDWLMADAALACGLECAAVFDHRPDMDCPKCCGCQQYDCPIPALLAGRAWVAEPTREREEAWQRADLVGGLPDWVPAVGSVEFPERAAFAIQAAAHVLGAARVREVVTSALLGRLL